MTELATFLGNWIALLFCIFLMLLTFGANFAPNWAKSRSFLFVIGALVIVGGGSIA